MSLGIYEERYFLSLVSCAFFPRATVQMSEIRISINFYYKINKVEEEKYLCLLFMNPIDVLLVNAGMLLLSSFCAGSCRIINIIQPLQKDKKTHLLNSTDRITDTSAPETVPEGFYL